jgi:hypothetical protein
MSYSACEVEALAAENENSAREANLHNDARELSAVCNLLLAQIEQIKYELARTKRKLRRAQSDAHKERKTLRQLFGPQTNSLPTPFKPTSSKRSETALAQVVLAAQARATGKTTDRVTSPQALLTKLRNRTNAQYAYAPPSRGSGINAKSTNRRTIALFSIGPTSPPHRLRAYSAQ